MTPLKTPTQFSEQQIQSFLANGYEQATNFRQLADPIEKIKIPLILISHTPPLATTTDRLRNGKPVGSAAIRSFIEEQQPDLGIAGHMPEAKGVDQKGNTAIEPGHVSRWRLA